MLKVVNTTKGNQLGYQLLNLKIKILYIETSDEEFNNPKLVHTNKGHIKIFKKAPKKPPTPQRTKNDENTSEVICKKKQADRYCSKIKQPPDKCLYPMINDQNFDLDRDNTQEHLQENEILNNPQGNLNEQEANQLNPTRENNTGLIQPRGKNLQEINELLDIKIMCININRIGNKIDAVTEILNKNCFDVLIFVHTQLKNRLDVPIHANYKSFHQLCNSEKAGGISILVKQRLKALSINALNEIEEYGNVWITIRNNELELAIGAAYFKVVDGCRQDERLDNIAFNENLWTRLTDKTNECLRNNISVIIGGDFNAHIGNNVNEGGIRNNPHHGTNINGVNLLNFTEEMGLTNFFDICELKEGYGSYYSGQRISVIDYMLWSPGVNVSHQQLGTKGSEFDLLSDHVPLIISVNGIAALRPVIQPRWKSRDVNWENFTDKLEEFCRDNPQFLTSYQTIRNFLGIFLLEYIGYESYGRGRDQPNQEEKLAVKKTRQQRKKERDYWKNINNAENHIDNNDEELRKIRMDIRKSNENRRRIIKKAKSAKQEKFFKRMCDKKEHRKPLFNWVKRNCRTVYESVIKDENGNFITENRDIKNLLIEYWASIFLNFEFLPELPLEIAREVEVPPLFRNIAVTPINDQVCNGINAHQIKLCCKKYKNEGDVGTSNIPTKVFKNLPENMITHLATLFNNWWETIYFPQEGKTSKVTLLPKPGKDHNKLSGYRTLSVGCNLCKLYLRILEMKLTIITERSGILGEKQNGFRTGRRATDNLYILNTVNRVARKKGWKSFFTFVDITKAFDRVDRERLWQKMAWFGYPQRLIDNIKETYRDSFATLHLNGVTTEAQPMPIGLRQGCVLSPVLFAIYLSDLVPHIEALDTGVSIEYSNNNEIYIKKIDILLYADDIVLIAKNQYELKRQLKVLAKYCIYNKLRISEEKSFVFPINRAATDRMWPLYDNLGLIINGSIPEKQGGRYLGVEISRSHNLFNNHTKTLKRKALMQKWKLLTLCENLDHRNWYGTIMWGTYGIPSILHGIESMVLNQSGYTRLDLAQNNYLRCLFKWNNATANAAIWGESGLLPPSYQIIKRKLNYLIYLVNAPMERLSKICLQQQFLWETRNDACYINSWWKSIKMEMTKLNIDFGELVNNRINLKETVRNRFLQNFAENKNGKITLRYYDVEKPRPDIEISHYDFSYYWLKAKVGGLYLNERTIKTCILCGGELEDLKHFLFECNELRNKILVPLNILNESSENKVKYILAKSRSKNEKELFGCCIKRRWDERNTYVTEL